TEDPYHIPPVAAPDTGPVWYVGDPGLPANEIQQIAINDPSTGGVFQLFVPGPGTAAPNVGTSVLSANATASTIQTALNAAYNTFFATTSVTYVTVAPSSSNLTRNVFRVEFVGPLASSPHPLLGVTFVNPSDPNFSVVITEVQQGSGVDTR